MKKNFIKSLNLIKKSVGTVILPLLITVLGACTRDFIGENEVIPDNEEPPLLFAGVDFDNYMLRYDEGTFDYRINYAGRSGFGDRTDDGEGGLWNQMAIVPVGGHNFVATCNKNKVFEIMEVSNEGKLGKDSDFDVWEGNYETFLGFHVGDRGFIFGQDSYGDHRWFVQEVTKDGKLAANECDNGEWHNYYKTATPLYVNGKTYLFFQEEGSYLAQTRDWFIASVSSDGQLTDVCNGYWAGFWERVTSVEIEGKTYLIGHRKDGNSKKGEWFIQRIYEGGIMGPETDRGWWNNYYKNFTAFVDNNTAYLYGGAGSGETNGLNYFFQVITPDGKMGREILHGTLDKDYDYTGVIKCYNKPGSFSYTIGWDLSISKGAPTHSMSGIFKDPWNGDTKFGGGAALANLDGDSRFDAVLTGIQSLSGTDQFYYKVAYNLGSTGKAASWSKTMFGPLCGKIQAGGGADIADIDGNGVPDLVLMCVDDTDGANEFWYYIGWNMGTNGQVASWSSKIRIGPLPDNHAGGGLALGDIDKNGRPDMVLMGIYDPEGSNKVFYMVLKNLNQQGLPQNFPTVIPTPFSLNSESGGGGAALADVNRDGKPDLVLTCIDSPQGANPIWYYIGWGIDINGNVTGWSPKILLPSLYNITCGGGAAIADINGNGSPDLLLMSVDNPYGND